MGLGIFTSCEDVIELDLDSTTPQLVIEGTIDVEQQQASVLISRSSDFYDEGAPIQVSDASVVLQQENGTSYLLEEGPSGTYLADNIQANPGDQFSLSVELDGQTYQAQAVVPVSVALDSIEVLEDMSLPFSQGAEDSIFISANWFDPVSTSNYYRIRTYVNGVLDPDLYIVISDEINGNGKDQTIPIRQGYEEGEEVRVELLSVDEAYYDYFFQISSINQSGANSTTPFNPTGNFDQDVLGYFGIYSASSLSIEL